MGPEISRLSASSVSAPLDAASSGSSREAAASRFESHPGWPRSAADAGAKGAGPAPGRGAAVDDAANGCDCGWGRADGGLSSNAPTRPDDGLSAAGDETAS